MASPGLPAILSTTWSLNRTWAATARNIKASLDRWRSWTLILAIAGSILSTLGQQLKGVKLNIGHWNWSVGTAASLAGAAAIALASYFAREALSGDRVRDWTKSRSAAEALKSILYIYRASVAPFDGADRDAKLLERKAAIENSVEGIESEEEMAPDKQPDLSPLTVIDYIGQRVDDQFRFYRTRAGEYQKNVKRLRFFVLCLGGAGVLLGVGAAAGNSLGNWVAVIGTVTAALSAHIQSQRYQSLIVTYQTTARRLDFLKEQWGISGKTEADKLERNSFIQACEDTMALENGAWVSQWSQQKPAQALHS